jgi:hypothetical protein
MARFFMRSWFRWKERSFRSARRRIKEPICQGIRLHVELLEPRCLPSFAFTTLDVPGSGVTEPYGINSAGQIVGLYGDTAGQYGFLYGRGEYTTLDVPDSIFTWAFGLNDLDQVVGNFAPPGSLSRGFLFSSGRNFSCANA